MVDEWPLTGSSSASGDYVDCSCILHVAAFTNSVSVGAAVPGGKGLELLDQVPASDRNGDQCSSAGVVEDQ